MDKAAVKLLLESYRPQDAGDPIFTEALREVAADPDLAAWFEDMQRFDAVMTTKFADLPVPPDVKSHILLGRHAGAVSELPRDHRRHRGWLLGGALAALAMLGLFIWHSASPRRGPLDPLAAQAIDFTGRMPPLQFVCFDAAAVAAWINEQPGSRKVGLNLPKPPKALSMGMIGSSVVDWNGRPVVMVCLQDKERMAMLYILSDSDAAALLPDGATQTIQKAGWVVRASKTEGQVRLLTTKGRPEDLDFQMPF